MPFVCAFVCVCLYQLCLFHKKNIIIAYLLSPTTEVEVKVVSKGARWHTGVAALSSRSLAVVKPIIKPSCLVNSCTDSVK